VIVVASVSETLPVGLEEEVGTQVPSPVLVPNASTALSG
jgi:hypothetical protein